MAEQVVNGLESVDVDESHHKLFTLALATLEVTLHRRQALSAPERACEVVVPRCPARESGVIAVAGGALAVAPGMAPIQGGFGSLARGSAAFADGGPRLDAGFVYIGQPVANVRDQIAIGRCLVALPRQRIACAGVGGVVPRQRPARAPVRRPLTIRPRGDRLPFVDPVQPLLARGHHRMRGAQPLLRRRFLVSAGGGCMQIA